MRVQEVIAKACHPIVELAGDESIEVASQLMEYAGLPAVLLIDSDRRCVGLLTVRGIVNYLAKDGHKAYHDAQLVTRYGVRERIPCCSRFDNLSHVFHRMDRDGLDAIVVAEGEVHLGILTFDIVAYYLSTC